MFKGRAWGYLTVWPWGRGAKTENSLLRHQHKAKVGGSGGHLGEIRFYIVGHRGPYKEFRLGLKDNGKTVKGILARMDQRGIHLNGKSHWSVRSLASPPKTLQPLTQGHSASNQVLSLQYIPLSLKMYLRN